MLDFFVALFGGLFYGSKFISDKKHSKRVENRIKENIADYNRNYERWEETAINKELEYEMFQIALSGWQEEPYYSEIIKAAQYLGWQKIVDDLIKARNSGEKFNPYWYFSRLVLMVDRGFLPYNEHSSGLSITNSERNSQLYRGAKLDLCEGRHKYDLMIWITKRLREHGINIYPVQKTMVGRGDYRYLNKDNYNQKDELIWDLMILHNEPILGTLDRGLY